MKRSLEAGFTLIEIVMVLVLLGILAGVAAPQFFDLRDSAELQAAKTVVAEVQSRINGEFADGILKGVTTGTGDTAKTGCAAAVENALSKVKGSDFGSTWSLTDLDDTTGDLTLTNKSSNNTYTHTKDSAFRVEIPVCK